MRHLADQPAHRVAGEFRVGIERDDVANAGGNRGRLPIRLHERSIARPTQQPIQLMKFSALAFPTDPSPLAFGPDPAAMKKQKALATGRRAVAVIELRNALNSSGQQVLIAIYLFSFGIPPVGKQREMEVAFQAPARWWISNCSI